MLKAASLVFSLVADWDCFRPSGSDSDHCLIGLVNSLRLSPGRSPVGRSSQAWAIVSNKPCHPNPTALVGDWLTREGNVIELVKGAESVGFGALKRSPKNVCFVAEMISCIDLILIELHRSYSSNYTIPNHV